MSPEAQRVVIARACGWTAIGLGAISWDGEKTDWHGEGPNGYTELPDYLNDLNAMHEAEKTLTDEQRPNYTWNIYLVVCRPKHSGWWDVNQHECYKFLSATATQRAEAFLRTIGKWEDGK